MSLTLLRFARACSFGKDFVQIILKISIHIYKLFFMDCKMLQVDEKLEAIIRYLHMHSLSVVTASPLIIVCQVFITYFYTLTLLYSHVQLYRYNME